MGMPYEYDIFVSHRQGGTFTPFVQGLKRGLETLLHDVGLASPRIFVDRSALHPDDDWPQELQRAHLRSKVFLPPESPFP
jgi:hypothetical protein